jgi:hypothetical protein
MKVFSRKQLLLAAAACLAVALGARAGHGQTPSQVVTVKAGKQRTAPNKKQWVRVTTTSSDDKIASVRYDDGYGVTIVGHKPGTAVITVQGEVVRYNAGPDTPLQENVPFSYTLTAIVIPDDPQPDIREMDVTVTAGKTSSVSLFHMDGLQVASKDPAYAGAQLRGGDLVFTGVKPGSAKVILTGKLVSSGEPDRPLKYTFNVQVLADPKKKDRGMPSQSPTTVDLYYADGAKGGGSGNSAKSPPQPPIGGGGLGPIIESEARAMQNSGSGSNSAGDSSSTGSGPAKAKLSISITPRVSKLPDGTLRVTLDARETAWGVGDGLSPEAKQQCEADRSKALELLQSWSAAISKEDQAFAAGYTGIVHCNITGLFNGLKNLQGSNQITIGVDVSGMGPAPSEEAKPPEVISTFGDDDGLPLPKFEKLAADKRDGDGLAPPKADKPKPDKPDDDGLPPPKPDKPSAQ